MKFPANLGNVFGFSADFSVALPFFSSLISSFSSYFSSFFEKSPPDLMLGNGAAFLTPPPNSDKVGFSSMESPPF